MIEGDCASRSSASLTEPCMLFLNYLLSQKLEYWTDNGSCVSKSNLKVLESLRALPEFCLLGE